MREILKKNLIKDLWVIFGIITFLVLVLQFVPIGLSKYKSSLEEDLSTKFHKSVKIQSLHLIWRGLKPILKLNNVIIEDPVIPHKFKLNTLLVGINVLASIKNLELKLNSIDIKNLNFHYKIADLTTDLIWRLKSKHWYLESGPLYFLWGDKLLGHSSCALNIIADSDVNKLTQKANFVLKNSCAQDKNIVPLFKAIKGQVSWNKNFKLPIKLLLKTNMRSIVLGLPFDFVRSPNAPVALSLEAIWKELKLQKILLTSKQKQDTSFINYDSKSNLLNGKLSFLHVHISKPEQWLKKISDLPNLKFNIQDFSVNNLHFGGLSCNTANTLVRVNIEECKFSSNFYNGVMHGNWLQQGHSEQTTIDARFDTNNLVEFLKNFGGWGTTLEAKYTVLSMRANWPAPLDAWSLNNLNANLYLEMQRGRITHLDNTTESKLVIGKLWSILSLQTIARRLKLDFSDLVQTGYVFDIFKGSFFINKGILYVKDGYFDGPVASIKLAGNIDLVKQLYNINFSVTAHVVADVPVLATMAAGPIAWISNWFKDKALKLKNKAATPPAIANNTVYQVSGPWAEPQIIKIAPNSTS